MSEPIAIKNPHQPNGKAHLVVATFTNGKPSRTSCGYGYGGTVLRMTERIEIERVDPYDRCKRCWPTSSAVPAARGAENEERDRA